MAVLGLSNFWLFLLHGPFCISPVSVCGRVVLWWIYVPFFILMSGFFTCGCFYFYIFFYADWGDRVWDLLSFHIFGIYLRFIYLGFTVVSYIWVCYFYWFMNNLRYCFNSPGCDMVALLNKSLTLPVTSRRL